MGGVTEKTIMDLIVSDYPWEQVIYKIICEEAMDPWDLDLTKLTEVFVDVLARMKKLDFRIPAKYIIIAAVLLKMKSDHLDFIDMVKESLAGPDPYPEDMFENAEETEVQQETLASGGTKFDAVKLHERRVHHRKVMFEELVWALRRAMKTETRRDRRVAKINTEIKIDRTDISKRIKELYRKIDSVLAKLKDEEVPFSSIVEEWNRENILKNFMPLMHLDSEKKVDCRQDEVFQEIFIKKS
ncbi:MAG: segregation/condensation protein A, partial [Candidatus Aenigmatarchaeota archaeon]